MEKNRIIKFTIAGLALAFGLFFSLRQPVKLGLDLKGGVSVLLKAHPLEDGDITFKDMEKLSEVLDRRINSLGVTEPVIQVVGSNQVSVEIPGASDTEEALEVIGQTALLEFKLLDSDENLGETLLTGKDLVKAELSSSNGKPTVAIKFSAEGARKFYEITRDNTGERLAITLDGKMESAPQIGQAIPNGEAVINGTFSIQEAKKLVLLLNAGSLPVRVEVEEVRLISPTLGESALDKSMSAGMWAFGFIAVFMIIWYLTAGFLATISLAVFSFLSFGMMNYLGTTLTLPGIAGFILSLGMAVDANVIIFEMIRERLELGSTLMAAIKDGFSRSSSSILDSNITTLIITFILFVLGTGPVKGYAVTLGIGIFASMFSAIFLTRLLTEFVFEKLSVPSFGFISFKPKMNLVKRSTFVLILSLIATGIAAFFLFFRGLNYGVDFTGGSVIEIEFVKDLDHDKFIESVNSYEVDIKPQIQFTDNNNVAIVKSITLTDDVKDGLYSKIRRSNGLFNVIREESIGATVGNSLKNKAILALIIGSICMVIYISLRFKLIFAIAALLALIHDILIAAGAVAFLGYEINSTFIIAILTILGYSINDTVVVFDRIRENMRDKSSIADVINKSVNQVFVRSLNTSLTTMLSVLALIYFSIESTMPFLVTFFFGIIAGTYSSLFLSSALVYYMSRNR